MAYYESVGLIASLFCLPLLGFLLGKYRTTERLAGEQDRAEQYRNINERINQNHQDAELNVENRFDDAFSLIEENQGEFAREFERVWNRLGEIESDADKTHV